MGVGASEGELWRSSSMGHLKQVLHPWLLCPFSAWHMYSAALRLSLSTSHSPTPWGHLLPVCVCSSLSLSLFLCVCVTYCSRGFGSSHWAFGCHSSYWEIGNARPPFTAAAAVAVAWPCRLTYCSISEINFNIVASSKQKFPFFGFYKSVNLVFSLQSYIFKVNSQIWSPVFKFSWLLSNKLMVIYKCYTKKTIFLN